MEVYMKQENKRKKRNGGGYPNLPSYSEAGAFVRVPQILDHLGIGETLFWQKIRDGEIPKAIKLGSRTSVWPREAIDEYVRKVTAEAQNNA
jgi:predicted DNA-binding transcriptional regulator AlpA